MQLERTEQILDLLRGRGDEVHLAELKQLLPDISESTLRRDLDRLAENGRVLRTYGGVRLHAAADDDVLHRRTERLPLKRMVARTALLELTPEHHVIYMDAGTTAACLAAILPEGERMVLTNDPAIALRVARHEGTTTMLLGGTVNPSTLSLSGQWSLAQLDSIHIDLAFMGTSGVAGETGFTNLNAVECDLKRAVIAKARRVVVLCDSGKFGRIFPFTFAEFRQVQVIASDAPLPAGLAEAVTRAGVACRAPEEGAT